MRAKLYCQFLIVFFLGALSTFIYAAPAKRILPIEHWTTKEGARVYFVPAPEIPMLDIQVVFAAGSARDGDAQAGIAHLTNDMLLEGAGDLNADQIASAFESVGTHVMHQVGRDMAKVHLRSTTTASQLSPSLKLFGKILSNPTFPKDGFERQQKRLLNQIREQTQNPGAVASNGIWDAIYGTHPYAHSTLGMEKSVQALTPEALATFFKTYYVAENAVIAMVGAIDRKQAETIAAEISSQLKRGRAALNLTPADPARVAVGSKQIVHPSAQTHVRLGTIGIAINDPDFFALRLGNHILGGMPLVSRLHIEVREKKGLSYHADSAFIPLAVPGPFIIQLQTKADQAKTALGVAQTVVKDFIEKGPTPEELVAAKKNVGGGFMLRISSNSAVVEHLANSGFYRLPLNYLDTYVDRMNAVTSEQVKDAFKRRIDPQRFAIILVGSEPANATKPTKR